VILREEDIGGRAVVAAAREEMPIVEILSYRPGQVAALNAGLAAVAADVTAITDDDAVPRPDWISRLVDHFADPRIAAVGGRDVVAGATDGRHPVVGRVARHGRIMGNHHRGEGPPRLVDALKGVNMAFRTEWVRRFGFAEELRGAGAEVHNDMVLCLRIRTAGGSVLYDPEVVVDHYPALRPAGDDRTILTSAALSDEVHNETLGLLEFLPTGRRALWLLWALMWGTRRHPGIGVSVALFPAQGRSVLVAFLATARGRVEGVRTSRRISLRT
jgi:GT2 family glycosyltransferase